MLSFNLKTPLSDFVPIKMKLINLQYFEKLIFIEKKYMRVRVSYYFACSIYILHRLILFVLLKF